MRGKALFRVRIERGSIGLFVLATLATLLAISPAPAGAAVTATTPWKTMTTPFVKSGDDNLWGVSCPSTTFCVAVGQTGAASNTNPPPPLHILTETWNGKSWRITAPNSVGRFVSVSCSSPTYCMAVGDSGLAELWNGTSWSVTQSSAGLGGFESVSCASTDCLAVGYSAGGALPFAESWDGHAWTIVSPAAPPGEGAALFADSCSAADQCQAVGNAQNGANGQITALSESFDGIWSPEVLPNADPSSEMTGVGCTMASPVTCMAVGLGSTATIPFGSGIADVWNQSTGSWTSSVPTNPTSSAQQSWGLQGVSCATASWCVGVGSVGTTSSDRPLAEAWNGSGWTVMNTAGLSALLVPTRDLNAVSCASATFCVGVGAKGLFNQTQPEVASWGTP